MFCGCSNTPANRLIFKVCNCIFKFCVGLFDREVLIASVSDSGCVFNGNFKCGMKIFVIYASVCAIDFLLLKEILRIGDCLSKNIKGGGV